VYIFILPGINLKPNTTFSQKLTQLDWLGIILFNASMACLTMAVNFGGTSYGWNSTNEITLWIFAGVVLAAFAMSEWLVPFIPADDRLYPTHFFRSPLLVNLQVQLFLASGILFVRLNNVNS